MTRNLERVGAHIRHSPHALDYLHEVLITGQLDSYLQPRFVVVQSHLDFARLIVDFNCAPVTTIFDDFNAGSLAA
jgi:hypothetical protein